MEITRGVIRKPVKCVIYGPEGVGKSSFAAQAPNPVWCDVEASSGELDVGRLPRPTSFQAILDQIFYIVRNPHLCDTFVLDTADWAEKLAQAQICANRGKAGIEDFGYGAGYRFAFDAFGAMLNALDNLITVGINVIICAHAALRRLELPDEDGAYDRWELKLCNSPKCNVAAMLKEWADLVLFANYKTYVIKKDEKDKTGKAKGGQKRVMYTTHHACWDAKNRHGLPDELPLDFVHVAHLFPVKSAMQSTAQPVMHAPAVQAPSVNVTPVSDTSVQPQETPVVQQQMTMDNNVYPFDEQFPNTVVQPLADLLRTHVVSSKELQGAVYARGYFPADMPIGDYPKDFQMFLTTVWPQVYDHIKNNRKKEN